MLPTFLEQLNPDIYLSDNYVVVDFETDTSAGPQYYGHARHPENQLLLACWKLGPGHPWALEGMGTATAAKWGNELEQGLLDKAISRADFVVAHNAKYELGWFIRMGIDPRRVLVFCTKLGEYVLLGNLAAGSAELGMEPRSTSLDMCCRRRGLPVKDPVVDEMIKNGVNPARIPRPWLEGRCRQDVETTEALFLDQRKDLKSRGLLPVLYTRCLLTPVLAAIEQEGLGLATADVIAETEKYRMQRSALEGLMNVVTGGVNLNSPHQKAHFLYGEMGLKFKELTNKRGEPKRNEPNEQFPDGMPLTDSDTIKELKATTVRQREFKELHGQIAKVDSILSKNLEFFYGVCVEHGARFFAEISQTATATHRTASKGVEMTFLNGKTSRVQIQNIPRILKKLFCAKRPGWLMSEPDGSQIEFRCAAVLGYDYQAIKDIIDPAFDAHLQTASILHSCTIEDVKAEKKAAQKEGRDDWRQLAKPDTYKPLYGGRFGTPEQEKYYAWFRKHYSGISKAQDDWVNETVETKRLRTPWGLTYHFPTARRSSNGRTNVESVVCNYPVQALATAEIVPIAVVYLWHRLREAGIEDKVVLVNMVHDSAPCEVHPDAVEQFTALVKRCFTADVYIYLSKVYGFDWDSRVPLGVGLKIGERWGSGEENSWDIYRDGREIKRK